MWNDIVIGEGDKLNSAWKAYEIPDGPSISENPVSYWVSKCILDIGMTIMKDTPEGQELSRLLTVGDDYPNPQTIKSWLTALVFRRGDPQTLTQRLAHAQKAAFRAGQEAKAAEIRDVLGL